MCKQTTDNGGGYVYPCSDLEAEIVQRGETRRQAFVGAWMAQNCMCRRDHDTIEPTGSDYRRYRERMVANANVIFDTILAAEEGESQ